MKTGVWNSVPPIITVTLIQCHFSGNRQVCQPWSLQMAWHPPPSHLSHSFRCPTLETCPMILQKAALLSGQFQHLCQNSSSVTSLPQVRGSPCFWKAGLDDLPAWGLRPVLLHSWLSAALQPLHHALLCTQVFVKANAFPKANSAGDLIQDSLFSTGQL